MKSLVRFLAIPVAVIAIGSIIFYPSPKEKDRSADANQPIAGDLIVMTDTEYSPLTISIDKGDTLAFENRGTKDRWPASNLHPTHGIYPEFDPKRHILPGEKWSFKFNEPGVWKFHDHLTPSITGTITVKGTSEKPVQTAPKINAPLADLKTENSFAKADIMEIVRNAVQLKDWLKAVGPKKLMQKLLTDTGGGSKIDCHQEAHLVGRIAYEIYGAPAFRDGNSSCHSGYYHGAMESFLREKGAANLAKDINEICNAFDTGFGRFECLHGVGHGVLVYEDYNLPKAIETCKTLGDSYSVDSCYGGMFMENIITGQGSGASKDHETKWVSKDPHFPCNAISSDYSVQYQCYQMQTSWMLTLKNYDFNAVAEECPNARPDMIAVCYKSLGRDAAGHTLRNIQKIKEICGKVPDEKNYYYQCIVGAVNVIIDFWGNGLTSQASDLCKVLPDAGKPPCYNTLAYRLDDLFTGAAPKAAICATFEENYKNLCEQ